MEADSSVKVAESCGFSSYIIMFVTKKLQAVLNLMFEG